MQDFIHFVAHHALLWSLWLSIFLLLIWTELYPLRGGIRRLSPTEAVQAMNLQHAIVLDIRNADAFNKGHVLGSQLFSEKDLNDKKHKYQKSKEKKHFILIGETDHQSMQFALKMKKNGFMQVAILKSGMKAWSENNMPLASATSSEPSKQTAKEV